MVKSHHYHTPLEYDILDKKSRKRHIRIRPLKIGYGKNNYWSIYYHRSWNSKGESAYLKIDDFEFWIKKKYLVRGPMSRSNKKNRWVWQQGFERMLVNAYLSKEEWKKRWLKSIKKHEEEQKI